MRCCSNVRIRSSQSVHGLLSLVFFSICSQFLTTLRVASRFGQTQFPHPKKISNCGFSQNLKTWNSTSQNPRRHVNFSAKLCRKEHTNARFPDSLKKAKLSVFQEETLNCHVCDTCLISTRCDHVSVIATGRFYKRTTVPCQVRTAPYAYVADSKCQNREHHVCVRGRFQVSEPTIKLRPKWQIPPVRILHCKNPKILGRPDTTSAVFYSFLFYKFIYFFFLFFEPFF